MTDFLIRNPVILIGGEQVEVSPYSGPSTEIKIEENFKNKVVYITGIPIKADYDLIHSSLSKIQTFKELHIP